MGFFGRLGLSPLRVESSEMLHLDLLRFIASVGIVLTHSLEFFWVPADRPMSHLRTAGLAQFVDMFFVISGFVIAYVYSGRITSLRSYGRFLQRRVGRLYPLHLVTLVAAALLMVAIDRVGAKMNHPPSLSAACLIDGVLLLHAMIPCGGFVPNGVSWSISAEMAMYVLFPLFLFIGRGRAFVIALMALLAFAVGVWFAGSMWEWSGENVASRAFPAFMMGMAFYWARDRLARIPYPEWGMIILLSLFVAGGFLRWPIFVLTPLCYAIPAFGIAADRQRIETRLLHRLAPLGQLTYSLYMLRGLWIMVFMNAIGDKILHLNPIQMLPLALFTYASLGVIAWLSLNVFETPMRRRIDALPIFSSPTKQHFAE